MEDEQIKTNLAAADTKAEELKDSLDLLNATVVLVASNQEKTSKTVIGAHESLIMRKSAGNSSDVGVQQQQTSRAILETTPSGIKPDVFDRLDYIEAITRRNGRLNYVAENIHA